MKVTTKSSVQAKRLTSYPLEYAVLGLLMDGPRHGYLLYQDFTREFHLIWNAGQAKFYAALAALEASGHLQAHTEPQDGRPARKVYQITETGRELFVDWLHKPVASMRTFRVEFMARLRFFSLLGLPGAGWLIDRQIHVLDRLVDEWRQAARASTPPFHDLFHSALNDYRQRQAQAIIDWLIAWREHFAHDEGSPDAD